MDRRFRDPSITANRNVAYIQHTGGGENKRIFGVSNPGVMHAEAVAIALFLQTFYDVHPDQAYNYIDKKYHLSRVAEDALAAARDKPKPTIEFIYSERQCCKGCRSLINELREGLAQQDDFPVRYSEIYLDKDPQVNQQATENLGQALDSRWGDLQAVATDTSEFSPTPQPDTEDHRAGTPGEAGADSPQFLEKRPKGSTSPDHSLQAPNPQDSQPSSSASILAGLGASVAELRRPLSTVPQEPSPKESDGKSAPSKPERARPTSAPPTLSSSEKASDSDRSGSEMSLTRRQSK